jgi:hypothetical protein
MRFGFSLFQFAMNMIQSQKSFYAMADLISMLVDEGADIFYVTSAPVSLRRFPEKFLAAAGFPPGHLYLRPKLRLKPVYTKIAAITEILRAHPTSPFILIGDNGEGDARVFEMIMSVDEFRERNRGVFIHRLYDDAQRGVGSPQGTIYYLTSFDLALHLWKAGFIGRRRVRLLSEIVRNGEKSRFRSVRERVLPFFTHPRPDEIQAIDRLAQETLDPRIMANSAELFRLLALRCSKAD